jgi:ribosomal protein S18 acetylase RimI-like enzyme
MIILREALATDIEFLWEMLTYAASMKPGGKASIEEAKKHAYLSGYLRDWKRSTDLGVVAEDGSPMGAVWARLLEGPSHEHRVATPTEPEISIAVSPEHQNKGLGFRLLEALITQARPKVPALVLSVREENPAVHLYERVGFVVQKKITNRVGGVSISMRLEF